MSALVTEHFAPAPGPTSGAADRLVVGGYFEEVVPRFRSEVVQAEVRRLIASTHEVRGEVAPELAGRS